MSAIEKYEPRPPSVAELEAAKETVRLVADTEFVPKSLRGKKHAILACILTGRELGLGPMQSLKQIAIVDGKAAVSAELMVALVRRAGHSITGDADEKRAVVEGVRADNKDNMRVTFTMEMAKRAGLVKEGSGWVKYPEAMLWARAVSRLVRQLFPDALSGVYTQEEVGRADLPPDEGGPVDELPDESVTPAGEEVETQEEPLTGDVVQESFADLVPEGARGRRD